MKTGTANLPLHYGSAPAWLFGRMEKLAREITIVIVDEFKDEIKKMKLVPAIVEEYPTWDSLEVDVQFL